MDAFMEIAINWLPMIVLIIVWVIFMGRTKNPQNQTITYLKKQNELMEKYLAVSERIAVSLEKISDAKGQ